MIQDGSTVRFNYTLTVDDEVVDSSSDGDPLAYVHGEGQIVPGLEEALEGLAAGDKRSVVVEPEKAYGGSSPEAIHEVPLDAFGNPEELEVGDVVQGEAQGQEFQARVVDLGKEAIVLDLNHPLAGKTLHFEVEIIEVS